MGKVKIIVIAGLIVLTIILFYFFISSGDDGTTSSQYTDRTYIPVTKDKLQHDIDSILYSFGIKQEWIKEISFKGKDTNHAKGQLLVSKDIKIPPDLLTIDLNYEITDYLRTVNFRNKVIEDPKTKNIEMNILSNSDSLGKTAGILKFFYSDSLKRILADVCPVLDSLDEYSLNDAEKILNSTQDYSVFLPLRNDKADYQSKIIELKKDFLLKFSIGNEDDIEADFKIDMKESFWKSKIRSIGINFPHASGVILINKSSDNDFYKNIKEEFSKNNLAVYPDSVFSSFRNSGNKVTGLFDDIVSKTKEGKKFLIYDINLNPEEFEAYDKEIYRLKKSGYRFFNFRQLMNRIQPSDRPLKKD